MRAWGHSSLKEGTASRADDAPRADRAEELRATDRCGETSDGAAQVTAKSGSDVAAADKSEAASTTDQTATGADATPREAQPESVTAPMLPIPLPAPLPVAVPQPVLKLALETGGEVPAGAETEQAQTAGPTLTSAVQGPLPGMAEQPAAEDKLGTGAPGKLAAQPEDAEEKKDGASKKDAAKAGELAKTKDGDANALVKEGEARPDIQVKELLAKLEGAPAHAAHRHAPDAGMAAGLAAPRGPDPQAAGEAATLAPPLAEPAAALRPTPLHAVPIEIGFRALAGNRHFDIRLDPADLGRIDVKLDFRDGEVSAKLTVDRVETLHLLQRDAKSLERAFDQAGLKTSDGAIDIQLRDRSADQNATPGRPWDEPTAHAGRGPATPSEAPAPLQMQRRIIRLGGIDVSV